MELLQKYYFVPLDIFRKNIHNKSVKTKLDAWLTFLTDDDPEDIVELIREFPEFRSMYEEVYELCRNVGEVMQMFSKKLRELDRNTVLYMIDVMQDEIDASKKLIEEQSQQLNEQSQQLLQQQREGRLYTLLAQAGRQEELAHAVQDEVFRKQLFKEFEL